ncbi:FAD-binding protein, partial [Acinetobacter baumannii]
ELGVPIWLDSPVRTLIRNDRGHVVGAEVLTPKGRRRVLANKGVVLACGGFPFDFARRQTLYNHCAGESEHWSAASPGNTGDGVR